MMVYADPTGPFPAQTPMSIAGCSAIIPGNKAKHWGGPRQTSEAMVNTDLGTTQTGKICFRLIG